jgi:hypothetical protein
LAGRVGLLVSTRRDSEFDPAPWRDLTQLGPTARMRGDETVEAFRLYRVIMPENAADAVALPRR